MASLLKLYLQQLPEPLVPYARYQGFLVCGEKLLSERLQVRAASSSALAASHSSSLQQGLGELRSLLCELPFSNFNLLKCICQ